MEKEKKCNCPECERREQETREAEELGLAVLIALMPVMTLTIFSTIGLI